MNIRRPITNSYSTKKHPPRLFDVLVENGNVDLEVMSPKDKSKNGPFELKGRSYEIISEWPLPPNHIVLKRNGYTNEESEQKLMDEGFELEQVGERFKVKDYKKHLVTTSEMLQFRNFITTCSVPAKL